ncbi:mitochondrial cytochrome c oxidase subunit VIa [Colletotrichum falcatum]|nr:mitochondrial cytochrome c oxidase subunit VIa [Colletotrichum falcatum]
MFSHSGCIPALGLAAANAWVLWNEHWEHWSHLPPLEERTEYSYQNIRTKNYQWGNGDKTIFWNDNVNYHNPDKA